MGAYVIKLVSSKLYNYLYIYSKKKRGSERIKIVLKFREISKNWFIALKVYVVIYHNPSTGFTSRETAATVKKHLAINMCGDKRINSCLVLLGIDVKCSI